MYHWGSDYKDNKSTYMYFIRLRCTDLTKAGSCGVGSLRLTRHTGQTLRPSPSKLTASVNKRSFTW